MDLRTVFTIRTVDIAARRHGRDAVGERAEDDGKGTAMTTTLPVERSDAGARDRRQVRALGIILILLALGMAAAAVLGPLVLGWMSYRTSSTTLNQLEGGDAAVLFVVAPLTLVVAVLGLRGHRAAPPLGAGIGVFAVYTFAQVIIGQEYLRLPGNVERYFPLLLAVFILAEAAIALGLRATPHDLSTPSPGVRRAAALALLLVAVFLTVGQHLRSMLSAWSNPARLTEYASSPTPFWMVKLMDLGIIVPAAVLIGVGLWHGASWALRAAYLMLTAYTCLGLSVAAMAVRMTLRNDPDASLGLTVGFGAFAMTFAVVTVLLYRPLFLAHHVSADRREPAP